jgi:hypothetical protein
LADDDKEKVQRFQTRLRAAIEECKLLSDIPYENFKALKEDERIITTGNWMLLKRVDVGFFVQLYLTGIPLAL